MEICFGQIKKEVRPVVHSYVTNYMIHVAASFSGDRESPTTSKSQTDRPSEHSLEDSVGSRNAGILIDDSRVGSRTDTAVDAEDSILQLNECKW